ncbi:tripeptidyl peptidase [Xylariaceae sp. AK1471]|nr:tripeptidyl peptidase [Xylariaceae sp. AK1471]
MRYLRFLFLIIFGVDTGVQAQPRHSTVYKLGGTARVPSEWKRVSRAPGSLVVQVSIGLVQDGFQDLEKRLFEVSDPLNERYGKHLSAAEVGDLVRPSKTAKKSVLAWLHQICELNVANLHTSPAGDWLYLSLKVSDLERLLQTEYFTYHSERLKQTIIRTPKWSVPRHLHAHIQMVEPSTAFNRPGLAIWRNGAPDPEWEQKGRMPTYEELIEEDHLERGKIIVPSIDEVPSNPGVREACNRLAISPLCLRVLYGTLGYRVQTKTGNSVGIVNFLGETANRSDVELFLQHYRPDVTAAYDFKVQIVAGGEDQQTPKTVDQMAHHKGMEGALDTQIVLGVGGTVPLTTYNVGGQPPFQPVMHDADSVRNTNEPYLTWLKYMRTLADEDLPSVVSISYAEDEKTVPPEYAKRVCAEFAQLGLRGVSILVASGDFGVGNDSGHCYRERSGDGKQMAGFMPSFPASCPYVTTVGATRFLEPEIVAFDARTGFSTGGGFSDLFPQPEYQRAAVNRYLEHLGDQFAGLFDPAGRAYPDVSAQGYHYVVMYNGSAEMQDGTSASTPTVAAVVSLINDALVAEGRPKLGFLNPWIYSTGYRGFTDVTQGSNLGCNTTGFPAADGWDPATGFGSPWFPVLKNLALARQFRSTRPWYYIN